MFGNIFTLQCKLPNLALKPNHLCLFTRVLIMKNDVMLINAHVAFSMFLKFFRVYEAMKTLLKCLINAHETVAFIVGSKNKWGKDKGNLHSLALKRIYKMCKYHVQTAMRKYANK